MHELRHYSATELIAAGVDVRTVAGRLGHGGGGTTTLRTYAAWVSEADQRAAGTFDHHMPRYRSLDDLGGVVNGPSVDALRAANPCQRIAADLRSAITGGPYEPEIYCLLSISSRPLRRCTEHRPSGGRRAERERAGLQPGAARNRELSDGAVTP